MCSSDLSIFLFLVNGLLDDLGGFADVWVYSYAQLLGRLEIEDDLVLIGLIEALDPEVRQVLVP